MKKKNKGITLIALVVTIIVLIILAGVSMNLTLGENGIITMAKRARKNMKLAKVDEERALNELYEQIVTEGELSGNALDEAIIRLAQFKRKIVTTLTDMGVETDENADTTMLGNIRGLTGVSRADNVRYDNKNSVIKEKIKHISKEEKEKMKNKKGITLVSLVITIIVLLILATISINLLLDTNLIQRVASAKESNEIESIREKLEIVKGSMYIDNKGISSIDMYFQSLNKEKIEPHVVTKIQKFTDQLSIVEVNNKYSFLIKFEDNIKIEYEGKVGEIVRKEPIIQVSISGEVEQADFPIMLTANITDQGEEVTNGKWVLNKRSDNIGIEENSYTEDIVSNENIDLKIEEKGEYYIHILTTDVYGRKKETVKGPIAVNEKYHEHIGDSSVIGGCYTNPVYHSHNSSCNKTCTIRYKNVSRTVDFGYESWCSVSQSGCWMTRTKATGVHSSCGAANINYNKVGGCHCHGGGASGDNSGWTETHTYTECGKDTSSIDNYTLGCDKTEETQEGYSVSY